MLLCRQNQMVLYFLTVRYFPARVSGSQFAFSDPDLNTTFHRALPGTSRPEDATLLFLQGFLWDLCQIFEVQPIIKFSEYKKDNLACVDTALIDQ